MMSRADRQTNKQNQKTILRPLRIKRIDTIAKTQNCDQPIEIEKQTELMHQTFKNIRMPYNESLKLSNEFSKQFYFSMEVENFVNLFILLRTKAKILKRKSLTIKLLKDQYPNHEVLNVSYLDATFERLWDLRDDISRNYIRPNLGFRLKLQFPEDEACLIFRNLFRNWILIRTSVSLDVSLEILKMSQIMHESRRKCIMVIDLSEKCSISFTLIPKVLELNESCQKSEDLGLQLMNNFYYLMEELLMGFGEFHKLQCELNNLMKENSVSSELIEVTRLISWNVMTPINRQINLWMVEDRWYNRSNKNSNRKGTIIKEEYVEWC
jgi:hypothetical protein